MSPIIVDHNPSHLFAQINLPDHNYRWAVIKGFTWAADVDSDRDLIAALLAHPAFKDHYCAPGEGRVGDQPLHGSYRLDAFSPESSRVSRAKMRSTSLTSG